ncbi:MAG: hypothetical protein HQL91_01330 [Magnetococcales bacterium]|nr:hypothetical protein [Magnetococcales bacterium]
MINYSQLIFKQQIAHLSNLISFGLMANRLQIENFRNLWSGDNVMVTPDAFLETKMTQQSQQLLERDIRITPAAQDTPKDFVRFSH